MQIKGSSTHVYKESVNEPKRFTLQTWDCCHKSLYTRVELPEVRALCHSLNSVGGPALLKTVQFDLCWSVAFLLRMWWNFVMLGRELPSWWAPVETPWVLFPQGLSWGATLYTCCCIFLAGEERHPEEPFPSGNTWVLPGSALSFPYCPSVSPDYIVSYKQIQSPGESECGGSVK